MQLFFSEKNNKDVFIAQNDQTETPLTKIVKQQTKTFKRNLREKQEVHSKKITVGFFDHYSRAFDVCGILQNFLDFAAVFLQCAFRRQI